MEACLVDNTLTRIEALDPGDKRSSCVRVAGLAALLVAKSHKIKDRLDEGRENRLDNKDAADLFRLMQSSDPEAIAATLGELREDTIAGKATRTAISAFGALFGNRAGEGIAMAARALRTAMPEAQVRAICLAYAENLSRSLG